MLRRVVEQDRYVLQAIHDIDDLEIYFICNKVDHSFENGFPAAGLAALLAGFIHPGSPAPGGETVCRLLEAQPLCEHS